jgi:hypothetical protein
MLGDKLKKFFSVLILLSLTSFALLVNYLPIYNKNLSYNLEIYNGQETVVVYVDSGIYTSIQPEINRYKSDIESDNYTLSINLDNLGQII